MIHAKIFIGESATIRNECIDAELKAIAVAPADVVILEPADEKEHIGISQVREFTSQMILSPLLSLYRAGVIPNAQLLTVEAQNALLKLIEEPPKRAIFLFATPTVDALLPTVISRCQVIQETKDTANIAKLDTLPTEQIESLIKGTPSTIISIVETAAPDRAGAKEWSIKAIQALRSMLIAELHGRKHPTRLAAIRRLILSLETARKELNVNVTPRLALEHALLNRG